jgi:uncharacterized membrane protein YcaP (DUF421 family)
MFFDSWFGLLRVLVVGLFAYAALLLILRISGKRTLSKWNAFDFVVTIALGSTLASILITETVALVEGLPAFIVLAGLQYLITSASVGSEWFAKLIKSEPTLLLHRGEIRHDQLRMARVTESEVKAALRNAGIASYEDAEAIVLETDGSFSVIKQSSEGKKEALSDIPGIDA